MFSPAMTDIMIAIHHVDGNIPNKVIKFYTLKAFVVVAAFQIF